MVDEQHKETQLNQKKFNWKKILGLKRLLMRIKTSFYFVDKSKVYPNSFLNTLFLA